MKRKTIDAAGIVFDRKSYVISDFNIISFIIRYALVVVSSFLIIYIGFNSFNIDIEIKAMIKIDVFLAFILMLADSNIFTALIVNGGLLYMLYAYINNNIEVLKNGIMSVMNESYSIIRPAFCLPDVNGFDNVIQDTALTTNIVAGVITVAVVMLIALTIGRYMSKIFYGIIVSLLLGAIVFGGGSVNKKSLFAILITFVIVCILNMCSINKISFGNSFRRRNKHIYFQKDDSIYVLQLCFIACLIGVIACAVRSVQSIPNNYNSNLKATVRDIAVMKYVDYKKFNNQSSFDAGQVGYQTYFRPNNKKIKTINIKAADIEGKLLKEFTGQDYVYRMNMWTSSQAEDVNSYLNIDEKNKAVIESICKEQNFNQSSDITKAVFEYLINNYTYSMDTEPLPYGKDFVNSFIEDTKSGNATHFASAAVLIFRNMGIPARYVSGYKIDKEQIVKSKYNRKTDEFNVNITNANAYAWVEIYDKDKGWLTVNVSDPPSMEEMKEFIDSEEERENPDTSINNYFRTVDKEKYTPANIVQHALILSLNFFVIIILIVVLFVLIRFLCKYTEKAIKYIKADNSEKALILMNSFGEKAGISTNSLKEFAVLLKEEGYLSDNVDEMICLAEKIIFSSKSEYNDVKKLHNILKSLKK